MRSTIANTIERVPAFLRYTIDEDFDYDIEDTYAKWVAIKSKTNPDDWCMVTADYEFEEHPNYVFKHYNSSGQRVGPSEKHINSKDCTEENVAQMGFGEAIGKCFDIMKQWKSECEQQKDAGLGTRTAIALLNLGSVIKEWFTEFFNLVSGLLPTYESVESRVTAIFTYLMQVFQHMALKMKSAFRNFYDTCMTLFNKKDDDVKKKVDDVDKGKEVLSGEDTSESDDENVAQGDDEPSFLSKLYRRIAKMVSAMVEAVYPEKFTKVTWKNWCKDLKTYLDLTAAIERVNPVKIFKKIVNFFYNWWTGNDYYSEFKIKRKMTKVLYDLEQALNDADKDLIVDGGKADQIKKYNDYISKRFIKYTEAFPEDAARFKTKLDYISARSDKYIASVIGGKTRPRPVTVCLFGATATGKTTAQEALTRDVPEYLTAYFTANPLEKESRAMQLWKSHSKNPLIRNSVCTSEPLEFDAEGYNHQMFHLFNELYTSTNNEINANWATILMKYSDTQPCQLNAAGLKGKLGVYYDTPFIFCTGNSRTHNPPVKDVDAYYRRIDLDFIVTRKSDSKDFYSGSVFQLTDKCKQILRSQYSPHDIFKVLSFPLDKKFCYEEVLQLVSGIYIRRITEDSKKCTTRSFRMIKPVHHTHLNEGLFNTEVESFIKIQTDVPEAKDLFPLIPDIEWHDVQQADKATYMSAFHASVFTIRSNLGLGDKQDKALMKKSTSTPYTYYTNVIQRKNLEVRGYYLRINFNADQYKAYTQYVAALGLNTPSLCDRWLEKVAKHYDTISDWREQVYFGVLSASVIVYLDGLPLSLTTCSPIVKAVDWLKRQNGVDDYEIWTPEVQAQGGLEIDWLAYGRAVYYSYQVCTSLKAMYQVSKQMSTFEDVSPEEFGVTYVLPELDPFTIYNKVRGWITPYAVQADAEQIVKPNLYVRSMKIYALAMHKLCKLIVAMRPRLLKGRTTFTDRNNDYHMIVQHILAWPEYQRNIYYSLDHRGVYPKNHADKKRAKEAYQLATQYHRRRVEKNRKRHRAWKKRKEDARLKNRILNGTKYNPVKKGRKGFVVDHDDYDGYDDDTDYYIAEEGRDHAYIEHMEALEYENKHAYKDRWEEFDQEYANEAQMHVDYYSQCSFARKKYLQQLHGKWWFQTKIIPTVDSLFNDHPFNYPVYEMGDDRQAAATYYTGIDIRSLEKRLRYEFKLEHVSLIPYHTHPAGCFMALLYIAYMDTLGKSINVRPLERTIRFANYVHAAYRVIKNRDRKVDPAYSASLHNLYTREKSFYLWAADHFSDERFATCIRSGALVDQQIKVSRATVFVASVSLVVLTAKLVLPMMQGAVNMIAYMTGRRRKTEIRTIVADDAIIDELNAFSDTTGLVFQSGENDKAVPKHVNKINHASLHKQIHATAQGDASDALISSVMQNMYFVTGLSGYKQGHVTFIKGKIAVMNTHVYESIMGMDSSYFELYAVKPPTSQDVRFKVPKRNVRILSKEEDAVTVQFLDVRNHKDLTGRIASPNDILSHPVTRGQFMVTTDGIKPTVDPLTNFRVPTSQYEIIKHPSGDNFDLVKRVHYTWPGAKPGACGSIGLVDFNGTWKIAFLHSAGNVSTHNGVGCFVTTNLLKWDEENAAQGGSLLAYDYNRDGIYAHDPVLDQVVSPYKTRATGKTILVKTPIALAEPEMAPKAPAVLNAEAYSNALAKEAETENKMYLRSEVADIYHMYWLLILQQIVLVPLRLFTNCRMLTFEEAMYGIPDFLDGFDFTTAEGLTLKYLGIKKRDLQDPNHPSVAKLKEYVMKRVESFARGAYDFQVNCDCLKDELRDWARVNLKKTRIFNVTDFVDNLLIKMFIGDLVGRMGQYFSTSRMSCGVNPTGAFWRFIYDTLKNFPLVFGDIKGWDHTAPIGNEFILWKLFTICYGTGYLRNLAMWAYQAARQSLRFNNGVARQNNRGNSSGNWATTFFNSIDNVIFHVTIVIYLAMKYGVDPNEAVAHLKLFVYSDDNLSSLPYSWWNNVEVSKAFFDLYGITFTGTDKGDIKEGVCYISDADFLSRGFREEYGRVYAPLSEDSLLAQLFYVRMTNKNASQDFINNQLQINLDNVARELFEYEPRRAKEISAKIIRIIEDNAIPVFFTPLDYDDRSHKSNYA